MANSFTNINDLRVMSECLGALKKSLVPLNAFSVSVGSDPAEKNATVYVPLVSAMLATSDASDYESGDTTAVGYAVNLSTSYSRSWHVTAVQASKTTTDIFEKAAVEAIHAIASAVQVACLNKFVAASFANSEAISEANFTYDKLCDVHGTLSETYKWRFDGSVSLLCCSSYYGALLADTTIANMAASGIDAVRTGVVENVAGFRVYDCPALADAASVYTSENLRAIAVKPQALAVAVRPPAQLDTDIYDVNEIVVDPDGSGIAFNYRRWVSPKTNALWGCVEVLFGASAVDGNAAYRITAS